MSVWWVAAVCPVVLVALYVAGWWLWPEKRAHRHGCGCRGCYEANLREAYRQHQEEERHRKGELR